MIRDISIAVQHGTPEWPGDTPFSCKWTWSMAKGASVNVSAFSCSPHVGTHADAPLHVHDGWPGVHELPLEPFVGRARIVDVSTLPETIELVHLEALGPLAGVERLLLKTGRTIATGRFPERWPALSERCARDLLGLGLRLLGVDAPSVDERESKTLAVHRMLFSGNACVLENLDLRRVTPGDYELLAAPLKLMGLDAAPVRAVLRALPASRG
ncbi:MAG TPA: cyclase family protein [Gemmatimonadaceae bacterium]|nr:cyclase family protein [Gemmatimonadaceae bacterium]